MAGNQNPGYPNVVAGRSTADNAPTDIFMDATSGALYNGIWVWNASSLVWEKMTQPKTTDTSEQYVYDNPDWVEMTQPKTTDKAETWVWSGSAWVEQTQPKTTDNAEVYGYNGTNWHEARIDTSTRSFQTIEYEHHEIHGGSHYYIEAVATLANTNTLYAKLVTPSGTKWSHFTWKISSNGILTTNLYEIPTGGMDTGNRAVIHANNRNVNCWSGRHTGADDASTLTDSGQAWTVNELVDMQIFNQTDGSSGFITANTATTVSTTLAGSTIGANDFDTGDVYEINNSQMVITSGVAVATSLGLVLSTAATGGTGFKSDVGGQSSRLDELVLNSNTTYLRSFLSGSDANVVTLKASWYEHTDKAV